MFESELMQMPGPRDIVIYKHDPRAFSVVRKPWGWAHSSVQKLRYPDADFRLIFFRKDCLNSLLHKLTSESFMVGFCYYLLEENRGMNCDVRVAVRVVGILNFLFIYWVHSVSPRVSPRIRWGFTTLDCPRGREFAVQLSPGVEEFSI